jgi:hypothetical protein
MTRAALAALLVLAACTGTEPESAPTTGPKAGPNTPSPEGPPPDVVVIADPEAPEADGIRLAAEEAGLEISFVDPAEDPEGALRRTVEARPPAVIVVRAPGAVVRARPDIEAAAVPVIEIGGDLYSDRALFRYAFQVSIPISWQARVLAHYLVTDRGYVRIGVIGEPEIARAALEEGRTEAGRRGGPGLSGPGRPAAGADRCAAGWTGRHAGVKGRHATGHRGVCAVHVGRVGGADPPRVPVPGPVQGPVRP